MSDGSLGAVSRQAALEDRLTRTAAAGTSTRLRGRLFFKYVALFVAVVLIALLANGTLAVIFYYREHEASLVRIQREQAEAAAAKIGQFIREIESQIGWTTQLPWSTDTIDQRRFDGLRLLRQVPAVMEFAQIDADGREQLRVSRLAMDVVGSQIDFAKDPKFVEAMSHKIYYGPVYFHRESEPYMTLSVAGARQDLGVSVAEVNLKLIGDVISQIKVGERGYAYVVDARGRLIAHPDSNLVLQNADLSRLPQVRTALADSGAVVQQAESHDGGKVLSAHATVPGLNWRVFVELPIAEANAPLYAALERLAWVLLAALLLAVFAGVFLAQRMVVPIQALRTGAARIGAGDLAQRISIKTGDELEGLAHQFNEMAGRLQESYTELEQKVEQRTIELSEALQRQTRLRDELGVHLARLEGELAAARRLQQGMVPTFFPPPTPESPVEIFALMEPAREVGGDLYDFFYADKDTLWFLVGDVSGKGMPAALFMARAKSLIRLTVELTRSSDGAMPNPSDIIARVNRELSEDNSQMMFVALFLGVLATGSGMLRFCNAGHLAPYRMNGQAIEAVEDAAGPVLGVQPDACYGTGELILAPDEVVYLATDGVVEAANSQGDMFSDQRLQAVLRDVSHRPCVEIVRSVNDAVRSFVGQAIPSDDITMLAIRRLDGSFPGLRASSHLTMPTAS